MQEFIRYTLASAIALLVDLLTLYALTEWFGAHYLISASAGFVLGAVIAYILSIYWCFSHRSCNDTRVEFLLFVIIGLSGLLLNNMMMWALTDLVGIYYMYSKFFTTGAVFLFNYTMRRKLLFTPKMDAQSADS